MACRANVQRSRADGHWLGKSHCHRWLASRLLYLGANSTARGAFCYCHQQIAIYGHHDAALVCSGPCDVHSGPQCASVRAIDGPSSSCPRRIIPQASKKAAVAPWAALKLLASTRASFRLDYVHTQYIRLDYSDDAGHAFVSNAPVPSASPDWELR